MTILSTCKWTSWKPTATKNNS